MKEMFFVEDEYIKGLILREVEMLRSAIPLHEIIFLGVAIIRTSSHSLEDVIVMKDFLL